MEALIIVCIILYFIGKGNENYENQRYARKRDYYDRNYKR